MKITILKNSIEIVVLGCLYLSPLTASSQSSFGSADLYQRPTATSPAVRVQGFSESEKTRLMGVLRWAAYGDSAPGAIRASAELIKAVSEKPQRKPTPKKSSVSDDDQCFFQIPERFKLFKATTDVDPCIGKGTLLLADTETKILYLCKDGKSVADFDIALGRDGVQKRAEGDERTPLGIYDIKAPRHSANGFFKFIHIGYPTAHQRKNGYTGKDVGIHGPSRWARCLGRLNTYFDWTNGCLAVASDRDINKVSRFVEENNVETLAVYPLEETGLSIRK